MKFIKDDVGKNDSDCAEDAVTSTALLEQRLEAIQDRIRELNPADEGEKAVLQVDAASIFADLQRGEEAWDMAKAALDPL